MPRISGRRTMTPATSTARRAWATIRHQRRRRGLPQLGHPQSLDLRRLGFPDRRRGQSVADNPSHRLPDGRSHQGHGKPSVFMSKPLEDYGMIGDGTTAALVSRDGSIDWLCWPRFDSPACLCALLGDESHGFWRISPTASVVRSSRRYRPNTVILEHELETSDGAVKILDFMPIGAGSSAVVRIVQGVRGRVALRSALNIRFEYGAVAGWATCCDGWVSVELGPHHLVLHASVPLVADAGVIKAEFSLKAGEQAHFALSYGACDQPPPIADCDQALADTEAYWVTWIGRFTKATSWPDAVKRSLLTLGALVYRSTGGVVAAPTTSLPEQPGGDLNWDYRYCWLRDATFTLSALLNSGLQKEAEAWLAWLMRAVGSDPTELRIMYRVDGTRRIDEYQLPHLPGYRHARPVRIGNAASTQLQLDVFGELLDSFNIAKRAGIPRSERLRSVEHAVAEHVACIWQQPDQGMWESRGEPRHYVYSKVMCWVGVDRYLRNSNRSRSRKPPRDSYPCAARSMRRFARKATIRGWGPSSTIMAGRRSMPRC